MLLGEKKITLSSSSFSFVIPRERQFLIAVVNEKKKENGYRKALSVLRYEDYVLEKDLRLFCSFVFLGSNNYV